MKVTIQIPHKVASELEDVIRSQFGYCVLSLPEIISACIGFSLYSSNETHPHAELQYTNLACKLISMQPRTDE